MKNIALLTGTINPKLFGTPNTKLINEKERLKQYRDAITQYLEKSNFDIIIFCENSNYKYNYSELKKIASKNKKILEIIKFIGNKQEMKNRGKSYGEGEIIEYALKTSKYLKKKDQTFYKITGRIFIKNINKILRYSNKENYFFSVGKNHCVTLFFKCSVGFFRKNLMQSYKKCNEKEGRYIENQFYNAIFPNYKEIATFDHYPNYSGIAGTTGKKYGNKLKWIIRSIQLKLGLLKIK